MYLYKGYSIPNLHVHISFLLRCCLNFLRHLHNRENFLKYNISAGQIVLGNQSVLESGIAEVHQKKGPSSNMEPHYHTR